MTPQIQQLREARTSILQGAMALIPNDPSKMSAEVRQKTDKAYKIADEILEHIQTLERSGTRPPRSQPGSEARSLTNEKREFRDWMRTGKAAEARDLGVGAIATPITGGNVLVPTGFDPQLHSALKSFGEIVGAVRTLHTDNGGPMKVALESDVTNGLVLTGEATAISEVDPGVSGFTSNVDELTTGMVKVTNQLLQDSAFDVDAWIATKFGRRYYSGLAQLIAQGNGSNFQKLTPSAFITGASGETSSVTVDDITNVYGLLDSAYHGNAQWIMTQATKVFLMTLRDSTGRSLLQPDATGKPFNSIFGHSIVISPYSDGFGANKVPIAFGDIESSYTLRMAAPLTVTRDASRYFEYNSVAFAGWTRAGGFNTSQSSSPSLVGFKNAAS